MPKKHIVALKEEEQGRINKLLNQGRELASVRKRAQALQSSHKGMTDEEVKKVSSLSTSAIRLRHASRTQGYVSATWKKVSRKLFIVTTVALEHPPMMRKTKQCW